jgi:RNA-binding protein 25
VLQAVPTGPAVTVFVGNITERAPDSMVRHLLTTAGPVISWKRVQGATGKLQAFGFCEYSNPDAGQRSIRLLNGHKVADKALVVKVDAKTKKILDEYIIERSKKNADTKPPEGEEVEKYMDEDLMFEDNLAKERIGQILADHSKEIENFVPKEVSCLTLLLPDLPMPGVHRLPLLWTLWKSVKGKPSGS